MPNLSSIVGQATDGLSSPSPMLRYSGASSHLNNGATRRPSFGFPRSGLKSTKLWISAAMKLEPLKIMISGAPASGKGTQCELIKMKVNENALVERVVGRRLDPVTGKTYHLEYSPPENEEIAARLVQRFDDTKEKVKLRLKTHHQNVESVLALYEGITVKVNGDLSKEEVFGEIYRHLSFLLEMKSKIDSTAMRAGIAH